LKEKRLGLKKHRKRKEKITNSERSFTDSFLYFVLIFVTQGAHTIFSYKGGYIKAVVSAFPEVGLDETKFQKLPSN
jgi:hypothetical protein